MLKQSWFDRTYLLLLVLGPLFWLVYYLYFQLATDLAWPAAVLDRFILLVLIYPILEEIVFRGLLLEWLARHLSQRWGWLTLVNVLTSIVFAGLHFVHQSALWAALIFFPSLVFGFAKERYRRLWAPIILHCWYNLGFIWLFRPIYGA